MLKLQRAYQIFFTLLLCTGLLASQPALATSKRVLDVEVEEALERFYKEVGGARKFASIAEGMLVFPSVIKAGFGIGGEYGEGALLIKGKTVEYYSTAAASIGFQIGAQTKTIILVFTSESALKKFRRSDGWEAGVDGSVALIDLGVGGTIDTSTIKDPIVAFVFGNKGLMYNLTLEGSKYTKLDK
jgi:lipid-binding SYLF domain-containing protein